MPREIIYTFCQLFCYAATVLFFFTGLKKAVSYIKAENPDSKTGKKLLSASLILLAAGILALAFANFFVYIISLTKEKNPDFSLLATAGKALWESIKKTGFLFFIPLVIQRKK